MPTKKATGCASAPRFLNKDGSQSVLLDALRGNSKLSRF